MFKKIKRFLKYEKQKTYSTMNENDPDLDSFVIVNNLEIDVQQNDNSTVSNSEPISNSNPTFQHQISYNSRPRIGRCLILNYIESDTFEEHPKKLARNNVHYLDQMFKYNGFEVNVLQQNLTYENTVKILENGLFFNFNFIITFHLIFYIVLSIFIKNQGMITLNISILLSTLLQFVLLRFLVPVKLNKVSRIQKNLESRFFLII